MTDRDPKAHIPVSIRGRGLYQGSACGPEAVPAEHPCGVALPHRNILYRSVIEEIAYRWRALPGAIRKGILEFGCEELVFDLEPTDQFNPLEPSVIGNQRLYERLGQTAAQRQCHTITGLYRLNRLLCGHPSRHLAHHMRLLLLGISAAPVARLLPLLLSAAPQGAPFFPTWNWHTVFFDTSPFVFHLLRKTGGRFSKNALTPS